MNYNFDIEPCAAPRMVHSDKWNKRPAVVKYFAFRDEMKYLAYIKNLKTLPGEIGSITFSVPMPDSWSLKKREMMKGTPHQQTPDIDNFLKGFLDALCSDDSHIYSIGRISKVWSETGSIQISIGEQTATGSADLFNYKTSIA